MGGRHFLQVVCNSLRAYQMGRLTAYIPMSVKRYSEGKKLHDDNEQRVHEERAPSTAEEFRRVAEDKSRQGSASHTSKKAKLDGSQEPTMGDSDSDVELIEET